jgi:hypothetical protein
MGLTENMISLKAPVGAIDPFCNPYFTDQQQPQEQSNLGAKRREKISSKSSLDKIQQSISSQNARLIFIYTHFYHLLTDARKRPCNCLHWKG